MRGELVRLAHARCPLKSLRSEPELRRKRKPLGAQGAGVRTASGSHTAQPEHSAARSQRTALSLCSTLISPHTRYRNRQPAAAQTHVTPDPTGAHRRPSAHHVKKTAGTYDLRVEFFFTAVRPYHTCLPSPNRATATQDHLPRDPFTVFVTCPVNRVKLRNYCKSIA